MLMFSWKCSFNYGNVPFLWRTNSDRHSGQHCPDPSCQHNGSERISDWLEDVFERIIMKLQLQHISDSIQTDSFPPKAAPCVHKAPLLSTTTTVLRSRLSICEEKKDAMRMAEMERSKPQQPESASAFDRQNPLLRPTVLCPYTSPEMETVERTSCSCKILTPCR